jgi:hypothetical protein
MQREKGAAEGGAGDRNATGSAGWGNPFAAWGAGAPDEASSRQLRWLAFSLLLVGSLGAVSSAARPLLRRRVVAAAAAAHVPERAAAAAAAEAAAAGGGGASAAAAAARAAALAPLRARLRALQRAHAERHPLWYGRPSAEMIEEARAALSARRAVEFEAPPPPRL